MKRAILMILGVAMVALLWPVQSVTVPEWRYRVVDRSGQPVPNAFVREHWQNYSFEVLGHEQDGKTDAAGSVVFPRRTVTAATWRRAFCPVWNGLTAGAHASYGPSAMTLSQHNGYEGWLDWKPGQPLPDTLVLSREIK
jgi:hypothetical protein